MEQYFRGTSLTIVALVLISAAGASPAGASMIESVNATFLDSDFSDSGGAHSLGLLTVSDSADIVVETAAGQTTYVGGNFLMTASLFADHSLAGLAAGEFQGGTLIVADGTPSDLLTGDVIRLDLFEVIDGAGLLAGQGTFEVTGGSLQSDFALPLGRVVQITFELNPLDIDDFGDSFTGVSNITLMPIPEPAVLALLGLGGAALLMRRKRR